MKLSDLARVAALSLLPASMLSAQNATLDAVFKAQAFMQTSSAAPSPMPYSWIFSAQSPSASKLTPPGGTAQNLVVTGNNGGNASLLATFTTKAAMDLAYPNGAFAFSGPPAATASLTGDLYTAFPPQVISGGTWTNGVLVLDPAVDNTITFSTFSDFATTTGGQVGGHEDLSINAQSTNDNYGPEQQLLTQALFGLPASSTPFTSFTIPAKSLTAGNIYSAELDYDRLASLDTTTLSGGAVLGIYQKALIFYFVAKSSSGTLNPPTASIPAAVTAGLGGSVTIPVSGSGLGSQSGSTSFPVAIWYFNGAQVDFSQAGKYGIANGQSLVINNVTAADAGSYYAVIVGPGGLTTTGTAVVTTVQVSLPAIVKQPQSVTVAPGGTAVFTVGATGQGLNYQWKFGSSNLTSALNGPRLILFGAGTSSAPTGTYSCTITNGAGSVTSAGATLGVAGSGTSANPGRLVNLSVGTTVPSGGNVTLGMTVGGSGTTGPQSLLIRGDGPTLGTAPFNLTGVMADPTLNVVSVSTGASLASNDNWAGAQAIVNANNATGAFPFSSASSLDAALVTSQPAGGYSAVVKNTVAANGYAIAEVFDATATYTPASARLINLSTLFTVPTGGSITAGFTVGGTTAKTVLIRADGPALGAAPFNLPGVMADPQLVLNSTANGAQLAVNAGWGGDTQLLSVMNSVSAFALKPASLDSAIAVTLNPGGYSATASSSSGGGGQVIIEVYEVQ